tara:strand:- start:703 stop:1209 length:507 start_codon:yes stop_codon:yes gene_type:complete
MEKYILKLTNEERVKLLSLVNKGKGAVKKLTHARILLATDESADEQQTDLSVAESLHVSERTVRRIRIECVEHGIDSALERKPQSSKRTRRIQGDQYVSLIALGCSTAPEGRCRWTLKVLADKLVSLDVIDSVSPQTIGRVLKKNELKPWQKKKWCLPEASADFVCKM